MQRIRTSAIREVDCRKVSLRQITLFWRHAKHRERRNCREARGGGSSVALGDLIDDEGGDVGIEFRQSPFLPVMGQLLMSGNNQVAARLGAQVTDDSGLDVDARPRHAPTRSESS